MNKTELVAAVAEHVSLDKKTVTQVLDGLLDVIPMAVAAGDHVTIFGFGAFEATERPASTGRNLRTGEPMEIPAYRTPKFKAAASFKTLVKSRKSPALSS